MKRRILLVDDELAILLTLKAILEIHGFEVETAASGREAISKLKAASYHMVITDMKMPGMNGIELQARLIAEGCRIPMIFMTAFPEESTKTQALNAGAAGFLTKPVPQQSLVSCLTEALRARVTR